MYAYTASSYRRISTPSDALPGESVAGSVPESVLDAISANRESRDANLLVIRDNAEQALTNLRAYRDLASPTNAQTIAAVKLLCRVCIGLIRLQLAKFDSTD